MSRAWSRVAALRGRSTPDESPSEAFTRDLFASRLARRAVGLALVVLGLAVAWTWNAVSAPAGLAAAVVVVGSVLVAMLVLDRSRWRGQDVLLRQQAGRERRWLEDTGGPSPIRHPAQAETWLGTHPRGSVPPLYRVLAASLAGDTVVRERELAAWVPMSDREAVWRAWAVVSQRAMAADDVELTGLRAAAAALPDGDDRRQLGANLAVADALRRHHLLDRAWLEPLLAARAAVSGERLRVVQVVRCWVGRFALLLSFVVPAAALAASGFGTPDPFPRAYFETTIATRGDVGPINHAALLPALSRLAGDVGAHDAADDGFIVQGDVEAIIAGGLPTVIWDVDRISVAGPAGIDCGEVSSIETLLGSSDGTGGSAIVTCRRLPGRAYVVPVRLETLAALRAALGVDP